LQTPRRFSEFLRELEQRREQAKAERQALYKGSPEEEDLEPDPLPKPQRTVRRAVF
jgi:predicted CopG family antitoxin